MNVTVAEHIGPDSRADVFGIIAFEEDVRSEEDENLGGLALSAELRRAFAEERFTGKPGQSVVIRPPGTLGPRRIAVVGAGARSGFRPAEVRHPAAALTRLAVKVGAHSLTIAARHDAAGGDDGDLTWQTKWLEALAEGVFLGAYRFDRYLTGDRRVASPLEEVLLARPAGLSLQLAVAASERGLRVAKAVAQARDLVNEPAATLTPAALAKTAADWANACGLEATVWGPDECQQRGMGLFLAVAQGSNEEPRFIHLAWIPPDPKLRIVLVGKGVTFDSGGLSLKTNEGMQDMKSDMAGAAAVLSAITVAAQEKLAVEVHALAACTENMPSGKAYKLGDVLRSMSGKTVEINNTDAEGRLTLADAITFGLSLKPDVVVDLATLTGACIVALGPHTAGVMTNDDATLRKWLAAAADAGEDIWPLPLPQRLIEQLKSEIADMRNTGERWGGALTAGLFLKEFVGATPWIHVDIAGPATTDKDWGCNAKGATGFGVSSIIKYLRAVAEP